MAGKMTENCNRDAAKPLEASMFEAMLSGGHPNSLGRTAQVVDLVASDRARIDELYACYGANDPVVRLRVSSAFKRQGPVDIQHLDRGARQIFP